MKSVSIAAILLVTCAAAFAQAPAAPPAAKPDRLALVIGNAAYKDAPLINPLNDAADMEKALKASGFTVIRRDNATLREMHLAIREFGDRLGRQSTGLFYFSGHGLQVRGRNYLLPVDADVQREDEVAFAALDLGAVMEKLDSAKNPVNIVVLDACRNNPFGTRLAPTAKGLAQVDAPPGSFIAFATAPGSTASDGAGRNGLYTTHLVKQMDRTGAGIEDVFKAVRASVRTESKSVQVPWESTSLETAFYFRPAPIVAAAPAPVKTAAAVKGPRADPSKRTLPTAVGAPPNFAVGDAWTYRIVNKIDNTERTFTTRVTAIAGDRVEYSNGNVSDIVGNPTRVQRGERVENHTPSAQAYVFPLVPGSTFQIKSSQETAGRHYDLVTDLRIGEEEDVETPAGKFRAIRIDRVANWKQRNNKNDGVNTWTYWYSSTVKRFVAGEQSNVTAAGKVLMRERQELVSYAVK
ncbi:hypothetical protein DSM104443_03543 [Usitatibacter rugosus]|uniref:Caspase family p20 domain-containing protein n=1 Tax=Usitatibacter rugosus TaxID=2732067 RepID=A0A6M4H3P4_9PROT|nr:caspase family protein [Usitatibacter rugosus]QJR12457.1 hypothetical protein DSM104443_03543 [Usitatibacter rugosus]